MKKVRIRLLSIATSLVLLLQILAMPAIAAPTNEIPNSSAPNSPEQWEKLILPYSGAARVNTHEGTPIGNGYFGAKHTGGIKEDVFQLNDKEFWSGDPAYNTDIRNGEAGFYQTTHESRLQAFENTRELLKEAYAEGISPDERVKKMREVDEASKGMWCASYQATYLPLGYLKLNFPNLDDNVTNYRRELNLDAATSNVSFEKDGVTYSRQAFASYPDNVMVIRLTNDNNTPMSVEVTMELPQPMVGKNSSNQVSIDEDKHEVIMTGRAPIEKTGSGGTWYDNRGITFESRAKAIAKDGVIVKENNKLVVKDATEILLVYTSETSYKDSFTNPSESGIDVAGNVRNIIDHAAAQTFEELLETHLQDYRSLFRRLWIDLNGRPIRAGNMDVTPWDYARHYQYSRYIMISTERENTSNIPHTLLGLWNHQWNPANESSYFLNENLQKMHALVGPGNIADTSEPLWNWIATIADPRAGGETARESFGIDDAWVVAHSSDIWGKSDLYGGSTRWANWTSGGIWLMNDLYNAFEFTQDIDFLEENYSIIEGITRFALGTLMEVDGVNGELKDYFVIAPSGSPEHWFHDENNRYLGAPDISTAGDVQLYLNLFSILEKASTRLKEEGIEVDEALVAEALNAKEKMIPLELYIDEDTGRFKEWYNEFKWGEAGHRHASHLLGLYLGYTDINPMQSKQVFDAQKKELQRLVNAGGGGHPDKTFMAVNAGLPTWGLSQLTHGVIGSYNSGSVMQWCPIGASIAETILDSRFNELNILPNLPPEWSSGEIKGIRGRGGYQLSIKWENNQLVECVIDSPTGTTPFVRYKDKGIRLATDSRFVVNRSKTSLEKLILEAEKKLNGPYTSESKNVLREAVITNNYEKISDAILYLEPTQTTVTVTAEEDKTVLTKENETLQLTATADVSNPEFFWSVTDRDGSATSAATITQDGVLTAKETGVVVVQAMLLDGSGSTGSLEITIQLSAPSLQVIDDRDPAIQYSEGWAQWNESKHSGGTISYTQNLGQTATLTFTGTGIEVISSMAGHLGTMEVKIDEQVVAPKISLYKWDGEYAVSVFKKMDLERGEHTITVTSVEDSDGKKRVDLDAFVVYNQQDAPVDKSALEEILLEAEQKQLEEYTPESWDRLQQAIENAQAVLNDEEATQADVSNAVEQVKQALESLVRVEGETFTITVDGGVTDKEAAAEGEVVTITANAAPDGMSFLEWTSEDVEFEEPQEQTTSFVMPNHDVVITAKYKELPKDAYAIHMENGTANVHNAFEGDTVHITASELAGKRFVRWETSDVELKDSTAEETSFVMPSKSVSITAIFEDIKEKEYSIHIKDGVSDLQKAFEGETVHITASERAGKRFVRWETSDVELEDSTAEETSFVMPSKSVSITAVFDDESTSEETYQLTLRSTTGGEVLLESEGSYAEGIIVPITAVPSKGYRFSHWTSSNGGNFENSKKSKTTFVMPANDTQIIAIFINEDSKTPNSGKASRPKRKNTNGTDRIDTSPESVLSNSSHTALKNISKNELLKKTEVAVKAAQYNNSSVKVTLKNINNIELETLKSMCTQTSSPIVLIADTMDEASKSVKVRLSLNPRETNQSVSLGANTDSNFVQSINKLFNRWSQNDTQAFELTQKEDFGQLVNVAVKLEKELLKSDTIAVYRYDPAKNSYKLHSNKGKIDANGYLHFTTSYGGTYIVSNNVLQKK